MSFDLSTFPPEYLNYDKGPLVIRVITSLVVLATVVTILRLIIQLQRRGGIEFDDWLIVAALGFLWGEYADGYLSVKRGGIGLHLPVALATKKDALRNVFICMFVGELLFFMCLAFIKWSILAMYYRIFPTKFMKWGYVVLGGMTAAWWVAVMLVTIFQCVPVHKLWDLETPGKCINANVFYLSTNGVPNIVMDAMILCLPIFEVYKLHVSTKVKIAIGASFLIGALVIIASIIKLVVMVELYHMGPTADVTYHLADLIIWVEVEPAMAIISACLPTLRPVINFVFRKTGLTQNNSERSKRPNNISLVTFGRGNMRHKGSAYSMTESIDNDMDMTDGPSAWPQQRTKTTSTSDVGNGRGEQGLLKNHNPQSINIQTDISWNEYHVKGNQRNEREVV